MLRQLSRRELLRDPADRAARPLELADSRGPGAGRLRLHRGLLQPPPAALDPGLPQPCRLRARAPVWTPPRPPHDARSHTRTVRSVNGETGSLQGGTSAGHTWGFPWPPVGTFTWPRSRVPRSPARQRRNLATGPTTDSDRERPVRSLHAATTSARFRRQRVSAAHCFRMTTRAVSLDRRPFNGWLTPPSHGPRLQGPARSAADGRTPKGRMRRVSRCWWPYTGCWVSRRGTSRGLVVASSRPRKR